MTTHTDVWLAINALIMACGGDPDLATLSAASKEFEEVNDALRSTNCGLDCEEHAVIELALGACAPNETLEAEFMEKAPEELPQLVKDLRSKVTVLSENLVTVTAERDEAREGYHLLDRNWTAVHNGFADRIRAALKVPHGTVPELLKEIVDLQRDKKEMEDLRLFVQRLSSALGLKESASPCEIIIQVERLKA